MLFVYYLFYITFIIGVQWIANGSNDQRLLTLFYGTVDVQMLGNADIGWNRNLFYVSDCLIKMAQLFLQVAPSKFEP